MKFVERPLPFYIYNPFVIRMFSSYVANFTPIDIQDVVAIKQ